MALFWEHKEFQDRAIRLWEALAARYKGNTWIAGYNPLNEPTDEEHTRVVAWYERAQKAIHAVDPDHVLFWDGNTVCPLVIDIVDAFHLIFIMSSGRLVSWFFISSNEPLIEYVDYF